MQPAPESLLCHGENPFANAFVRTPWDQDFVDVPAIHGAVTKSVTEAIQDVRQSGKPRGMLLLGEPGFGKSHLLARFQRLELDHKMLTFVEPPASPDRPIRHILRETVVRLGTSRGQPMSQLEWLAANFFVRAAAFGMRDGVFFIGEHEYGPVPARAVIRVALDGVTIDGKERGPLPEAIETED